MNGDLSDPPPEVITGAMRRAGSTGYEDWWGKVTDSGYCASPIRLASENLLRSTEVFARCKNRRASVCPSCSQLYAGDTWQLVHAGIIGAGSTTPSPALAMVFATLTAPSFGPVHTAALRASTQSGQQCQPARSSALCRHGRHRGCAERHRHGAAVLGEPLCLDCYDYSGHVLFAWHAPELWHRFRIKLRRLIARSCQVNRDAPGVKLAYVKVVEMQRRGIPHFHAIIRLDHQSAGPEIGPVKLAALVRQAGIQTALEVTTQDRHMTLRYGEQIDVRPLDETSSGAVAAYLAKYVTKSVGDFGLTARRLHEGVIDELGVSDHIRRILHTIAHLAREPQYQKLGAWLHTLGYRGHVASKTPGYSTTMGELRARRDAWRRERGRPREAAESEPVEWRYLGCGHANDGERFLAVSAAERAREMRRIAREELAG